MGNRDLELDRENGIEGGSSNRATQQTGNGADSRRTGQDSLKAIVQSVKLEAEKNAIAAALEKTRWNRKAAARLLKVSYRTLLYKIEQYHMSASDVVPFPGGNGTKTNGNGTKTNGRVS